MRRNAMHQELRRQLVERDLNVEVAQLREQVQQLQGQFVSKVSHFHAPFQRFYSFWSLVHYSKDFPL